MFKRTLTAFLMLGILLCGLCGAIAEDAGGYYIEVDLTNQITTVYRAGDGAIVRQMICSTGAKNDTPTGRFNLAPSRDTDRKSWYWIIEYRCFVKYPTRIQGHILFHSLPYAAREMDSVDREAAAKLGQRVSHGCVRLRWQDAKWIALNCPDDTPTRIFTGTARDDALRELLLQRSYTGRGGESYEEFTADLPGTDRAGSLIPGDSGEAVEALQRQLIAMGIFRGPLTGEYDALTIASVIRFQLELGLWPTGIANHALLKRLGID